MCEPDNPQCSQRDPTKIGGGAAFGQRWDVFLIIDEMARLMGTSVVSASMGGQPVSKTTTIFVGGFPFGWFGAAGSSAPGRLLLLHFRSEGLVAWATATESICGDERRTFIELSGDSKDSHGGVRLP